MKRPATVVLVEPNDVTIGKPFPPISLLALMAATSERDDVACKLVDYKIGQTVDPLIGDPDVIAFGISSRTGDCLASAIRVAQRIKRRRPAAPIIWGGVHVTSVPEEAAAEPFVDIVVRGDGEDTLNDLLTALTHDEPLDRVRGIVFKRQGRIVATAEREPVDLGRIGPLPYEVLDLRRYDTSVLWMNTSRGCPYSCQFCTNAIQPGFRSAMPPQLVVDHLLRYTRLLGTASVFFSDYNFFGDLERVRAIARRLIRAGVPAAWGAYIVAKDACRLGDADLRLLQASGCTHLASGQDAPRELMRLVRKPSTYEQVDEAIRRVSRAGILSVTHYIVGLPGESRSDLLSVVHDIKRRDAGYGQPSNTFVFFPWPGTPIAGRVGTMNSGTCRGMAGWSNVMLGDTSSLRFLSGHHRRLVQTVYYVTSIIKKQPLPVFMPPRDGRIRRARALLLRAIERVCLLSARSRWERERFSWGVEWQLLHGLARARHHLNRHRALRVHA